MAGRGRSLPKFDSTGWLALGVLVSAAVFALNLWAFLAGTGLAFLPFRLGQVLGMAVALVLGLHCVDMMMYYRRHGRLMRD